MTITRGEVKGNVHGGVAPTGEASSNIVTIRDGEVGASVYGGYNGGSLGKANKNKVIISGGTITEVVAGGFSGTGTANGNQVTISGATINENIVGGVSCGDEVKNNTVIIKDAPTFGANTQLLGSNLFGPNTVMRSGNTLEMRTKGITVKNIANFENLYFYLPDDIQPDEAVLTITSADDTNIEGTKNRRWFARWQ